MAHDRRVPDPGNMSGGAIILPAGSTVDLVAYGWGGSPCPRRCWCLSVYRPLGRLQLRALAARVRTMSCRPLPRLAVLIGPGRAPSAHCDTCTAAVIEENTIHPSRPPPTPSPSSRSFDLRFTCPFA